MAGQTVTIYARRHLLLAALAGFVLANLVTAVSLDFTVTMAARFVAGAASGVVWSLLCGYAARLVGPALKGRAMAFAFAGTPVALSLGVPVGAYLGQAVGWQVTFGLASAVTVVLIAWTAWKLSNFAGQKTEDRISLYAILRLRGIRTVLAVTGAFVLAHTILRSRRAAMPAPASGLTVPGVRALTTEQVERIRDNFIAAARRAEQAGFDGVSLHGAFGWILSEFLSPLLNERTDKYGGSTENRARLTIEVIEGILRRDFPRQVAANPCYESPKLPVTAQYLRTGGLSERFISHMRRWPYFVHPASR